MSKYTYYAALLVVGLTPLDAITVTEGVSYGRLSFILLIVCALLSGSIYKVKLVNYISTLLIFTLWASLTMIWSFEIEETITRTLYLIQYLAIVIILHNVINTPKRFKYVCVAWIVGALYIGVRTIKDFLNYGYSSDTLYRVEEYGNPNENSFMLCFAVVLLLIISHNKLKQVWLYIYILFSFLAILANGSRTGLIMFIVIIVGLILTVLNSKKKVYLLIIPLFIIAAIYIFNNILPESTYLRFTEISDNIEVGNLAHREEIWENAYGILCNVQWIFFWGTGWGTFALVYQYYTGTYIGSHNFYINLIFTTGILGFGIILYYFTILIQYIRRIKGYNILPYLLIIIPLFSMLTTNWESRRWWFLLGVFIHKLYYFSQKENHE